MNEIPISGFEDAIRSTHGCEAELSDREAVVDQFEGCTAWEGEVLVFSLSGHPSASTCYAWEVDGRVTAVLHDGSVDSPLAAVRAAIAAEHGES